MSFFKNKVLVKIIVFISLFLITIGLGTTNRVYAGDDEIWGGTLLQPIIRLLLGLGDGIIDILHEEILQQEVTLIKIDGSSFWANFGTIVLAILAAVLFIVVAATGVGLLVNAGVLAITFGVATKIVLTTVLISAGIGAVTAEKIKAEWIPNDIYLPVYTITPQEIFSNEIVLFDVNFFKPMDPYEVKRDLKYFGGTVRIYYQINPTNIYNSLTYGFDDEEVKILSKTEVTDNLVWGEMYDSVANKINPQAPAIPYGKEFFIGRAAENMDMFLKQNYFKGMPIVQVAVDNEFKAIFNQYLSKLTEEQRQAVEDDELEYGRCFVNLSVWDGVTISDQNIYKEDWPTTGKGYTLIYHDTTDSYNDYHVAIYIVLEGDTYEKETVVNKINSTATELKGIVSSWYFILRNLALLILMLVLIYTGIKIVTGSTAGEKAKYKERLMDWLVAMCLVFLMHYIMAFSVELNEKVIGLVTSSVGERMIVKSIGLGEEGSVKYDSAKDKVGEYIEKNEDENKYYIVWETDLMGGVRINAQESKEGTAKWVGSAICFLILVAYTCFFTWTYLKRVLYMTFLTMIAPLVAMTYPIDKITDGKAQAFNSWLKEYIFNLLIQPMHLLLYTILVSSAYDLASVNILYSIVAIGFMTPAEKLVRKFFGFEKAQTPGALGGAAGAALAMTGMQQIMQFGKGGGNGTQEKEEEDKLKFSSSSGVSAMDTMAGETDIDADFGGDSQGIQFQNPNQAGGVTVEGNGGVKKTTSYTNEEMEGDASGQTNGEGAGMRVPTSFDTAQMTDPLQQFQSSMNPYSAFPNRTYNPDEKKRRIRRTLKAMGSSYKRQLKDKTLKRFKNGRPVRALARGALGLFGGAAFGIAGLALGIASGDPSKAFQYATTGMVGGYQTGKGVAGRVVDTLAVSTNKMKDEAELAWYGEDYKKAKLEESKRKLLEKEDYISYIRKTTGASRDEAIEILSETGSKCLDSGISGVDDIVAIDELTKRMIAQAEIDYPDMTIDERAEIEEYAMAHSISIKKLSDRLPTDIRNMGEKKIESYRKQFQKELEDKLNKQSEELEGRIEATMGDSIREEVREKLKKRKRKYIFRRSIEKIHIKTNRKSRKRRTYTAEITKWKRYNRFIYKRG